MVGFVFRPESIMRRFLVEFLSSESGATAIEYGLIFIGLSVTVLAAVDAVGHSLKMDVVASAAAINP
jgi:pilus assembly protein Flp/PilA